MPAQFEYDISPEKRLIYVVYFGSVTLRSVTQSSRKIWEDPLYDADYRAILDFRKSLLELSPDEMPQLIEFFKSAGSNLRGRLAVVIDQPSGTAFSLMFKQDMQGTTAIEVFSTLEAARKFVGL
jgi:hypothetical protein